MTAITALPTGSTPRYRSLVRDLTEGFAVGVLLMGFSYIVALRAGWIEHVDSLEVFAVVMNFACVYLCVRERRLNYAIGIIASLALVLLFYRSDLLLSAALNLYFVPVQVYGWVRWRRDIDTRPVTRIAVKWIPAYVAVTGIAYLSAVALSKWLEGSLVWTDAVIFTFSVLAQFLLDNKKVESWAMWAIVNVFAIYTYSTSGLPLVAFQYGFFLINTAYGFWTWHHGNNYAVNAIEP